MTQRTWRSGIALMVAVLVSCSSPDHGPREPITSKDGWEFRDSYVSPACKKPNACVRFTDKRDGHEYATVQIGSQRWMAEALNYGERIERSTLPGGDVRAEKVCPLDAEQWCQRVGAQYSFHQALALPARCDSGDCSTLVALPANGICPSGFHLPTAAELRELLANVGTPTGTDCNTAVALRATSGWRYENVVPPATDSSGFTLFPQTLLKSAGTYFGNAAAIWAAGAGSGVEMLEVTIGSSCATLARYSSGGSRLGSVRCIAD